VPAERPAGQRFFVRSPHLIKISPRLLSTEDTSILPEFKRKKAVASGWMEMQFCPWLGFGQIQQRSCFSFSCVLPCENQTKNTNFAAFFIVPDFEQSLRYELCRRCRAKERELAGFSAAGALPEPGVQLRPPAAAPAAARSCPTFLQRAFHWLNWGPFQNL